MVTPEPPKRGRPANALLLEKAAILREHLEQPAIVGQPAQGTRFAHYYPQLNALPAFAIAEGRPRAGRPSPRLKRWWERTHRVQLNAAEIEACWKWLLPQ